MEAMSEHTYKQFDIELESLRTRVLQMGGFVEQQVVKAMEGLLEGDLLNIDRVIENDHRVNQQQIELDEACTQIIARRQPAANDLRTIMSVARVVTDLERIGDEAKKIAKVARSLAQAEVAGPPRVQMKHLGAQAVAQLRKSLDAMARLDIDAAAEVVKEDRELDEQVGERKAARGRDQQQRRPADREGRAPEDAGLHDRRLQPSE